jgi:hypothetical protein
MMIERADYSAGAVVLYQEPLVSPPMYPSLFWWIQNADAQESKMLCW